MTKAGMPQLAQATREGHSGEQRGGGTEQIPMRQRFRIFKEKTKQNKTKSKYE